MDETGVDSLTKNTCLQNIVDRFADAKQQQTTPPACQMCAVGQRAEAAFMCEQCDIFYCESCRDSVHPMRGPLLKHTLVAARLAHKRKSVRSGGVPKEAQCAEHAGQLVSVYCLVCKCACCSVCLNDNTAHLNHPMQQLNAVCKAQKVSGLFSLPCFFE